MLLGVRTVIAESFERIHRSNLVGMGVLPLQFHDGESAASLGLTGSETFTITGVAEIEPRQDVEVKVTQGGRHDVELHRALPHRHLQRTRIFPLGRNPPVRAAGTAGGSMLTLPACASLVESRRLGRRGADPCALTCCSRSGSSPASRRLPVDECGRRGRLRLNGWWHGALPSAALNVIWMLIAAVALWRIMEKRRIVDLSHVIEEGMTTYKGLPGPHICDFWTREGSAANYDDGSTFQIGRIDMVANTGTYLDAPFHRYAEGADLAELPLPSLAELPGIVVRRPWENELAVDADAFEGLDVARQGGAGPHRLGPALADAMPISASHPFLTAAAARLLVEQGAALVGIDSYNIDNTRVRARPVHTCCSAPASRSASI